MASNRKYPMNMPSGTESGRIRLSDSSAGRRVFMTIVWVLVCVMWLALLVATAAAPHLQDRGALFSLLLVIALISIVSLAVLLAQVYRFAVWIDGTTLTIRQWNGEKRWYLPSSVVVVQRSPGAVRLTLQDDASRRRTQLRIRESRLQNMSALAGAIIAARPGDMRASQAAEVLMREAR